MTNIFITIEGVDGSGKTTQINLLYTYLKSINRETIITREPGGTKLGEKIRALILDKNNDDISYMTEALLYTASRAQIVEEIILPALKSNKIVICDRFVDSSLVYQGVARGLGIEKIAQINEYALNGLVPDITFYLDIDPKLSILRKLNQSNLDRIENENLEFHNKVYEGYKRIVQMYPKRIFKLDATQSKEDLHIQILNILKKIFKEGN